MNRAKQVSQEQPTVTRHLVELPIRFQDGVGQTRVVSREEVVFTTSARVTAGDCLTGEVPLPADDGGTCMVMQYQARVLLVTAAAESGDLREVHACFEKLDVALIEDM